MKKVLKIVGIILLILVVAVILLLFMAGRKQAVPEDYTKTVKTGGDIEAKYLGLGSHEVSYYEAIAVSSFKKFEIYYPSDIEKMDTALPVVVFVNGTSVLGSKYPALQKHLASWGFITIATEEEHAWFGFSAEMSVRYLEYLNQYEEVQGKANIFYHRIDIDNVGITGHSQGGFGVVNAITEHRHKDNYKAAVILSSNAQTNPSFLWDADATKVTTPTLILGSTGKDDASLAPPETLQTLYDQIPDNVDKLKAIRNDADHGTMLYSADGYVTAWFMWQLKGDEEAAKAFTGDSPEIMTNSLYQDQITNIE